MNLTQHCDSTQTYQNQAFHSLWRPFSSSLLLYFIARIIASHDELRPAHADCIIWLHTLCARHAHWTTYDVISGVI